MDKYYNLIEIDAILQNIGSLLDTVTHIIAVGGYCMLVYKARELTVDVDFISSESEFIIPYEYKDIINSDVLNISDLSLDFDLLWPYCHYSLTFNNLYVHLADFDLLLAMKLAAKERRTTDRDDEDFYWLYGRANKKRTFKAYKLITQLTPRFDDWLYDLDTEFYIIQSGYANSEFAASTLF